MFGGVGYAGRPWLLGVRNSARHRTRTALVLTSLTAAGAFFITALSIRTSMIATADRLFGTGTYGAVNRYAWDQHMLMIYVFLIVVSGVLAAIGGLGLMTATSLNVLDRRGELGVLRAIGATPEMVGAIVVIEAIFVSLLAWVLAVLAGWLLTVTVGGLITAAIFTRGLHIAIALTGIAGWLGISTALAIVSSLAPAIWVSRRPVQEAVTYE